jgi:hypothetical protein
VHRQVRLGRLDAHPQGTARRGRGAGAGHELPVQTEVHVGDEVTLVVLEQVLAVRGHPQQTTAVEERGAVGEPALRAAHRDHPIAERGGLLVGQPMQRVTFWHPATLVAEPW